MSEKDKITVQARKRALAYSDRVSALAAAAPDAVTQRVVFRAASAIKLKYGFSAERKKAIIMNSLRRGARTTRDLAAVTEFDDDEIRKLVRELEAAGRVELQTMSLTGGAGRPGTFILPIEEGMDKFPKGGK